MILKLRKNRRVFEVEIPEGSSVETTSSGTRMLLIPGLRPEDTYAWLPAHLIVGAARLGYFGLHLRREWIERAPDYASTNQPISA